MGSIFCPYAITGDSLVTLRTRLKGEPAKLKYHPGDLRWVYVYDPFEQQYVRVPALDQEYTQGLSLWKHRIIRQAVLEEQDQVDLVALGKARRKIQQLVEAGRKRKHQATRSRLARWDTSGKPSRQLNEGAAPSAEPPQPGGEPTRPGEPQNQPAPRLPGPSLEEEEGWEVGYAAWQPMEVHPERTPRKVSHE